MKLRAYRLRSFQGAMITLVVESDNYCVVTLSNKVSFIDARVVDRETFEEDYAEFDAGEALLQLTQQQFVGYGRSVGMTPAAGVYIQKLGLMQGADLYGAVRRGMATQATIKKEALRMAHEDKDPIAGKAPRKLAGAALKAVQAKEARLAAEAKLLAGDVSQAQEQVEAAGAPDVTLPKPARGGPKKADAKKAEPKQPKGKREPKVTKDTPSADQAKKIINGKARSDAQVSADGEFDPAKLKNSDGDYKSASAMFKGLLWENNSLAEAKRLTDDAIAKQVDKKFGLGEQKAKDYVKWNRGWFRRQGVTLVDAK